LRNSIDRRQALPIGDTMTIDNVGNLRVVAPPLDHPLCGEFGAIGLEMVKE